MAKKLSLGKKALKAGVGGILGGAKLIGTSLAASTGALPLVGAGLYVAGAAKKGWNYQFKKSDTRTDLGLNEDSRASEIEFGETTILDKILEETTTILNVLGKRKIPESQKRELQLDRDKRHKELIDAFKNVSSKSLALSKKQNDKGKDKESWVSKLLKALGIYKFLGMIKNFFKRIFKLFRSLARVLSKFARVMIVLLRSPLFLGIAAALMIMINWKKIKLKIKRIWYKIVKGLKKALSFIGLGDLITLPPNPDGDAAPGDQHPPEANVVPSENPNFNPRGSRNDEEAFGGDPSVLEDAGTYKDERVLQDSSVLDDFEPNIMETKEEYINRKSEELFYEMGQLVDLSDPVVRETVLEESRKLAEEEWKEKKKDLPAFKGGGSFTVVGPSGDNTLVQFYAENGEKVTIETLKQQRQGENHPEISPMITQPMSYNMENISGDNHYNVSSNNNNSFKNLLNVKNLFSNSGNNSFNFNVSNPDFNLSFENILDNKHEIMNVIPITLSEKNMKLAPRIITQENNVSRSVHSTRTQDNRKDVVLSGEYNVMDPFAMAPFSNNT